MFNQLPSIEDISFLCAAAN